jgi:hypothetical protein
MRKRLGRIVAFPKNDFHSCCPEIAIHCNLRRNRIEKLPAMKKRLLEFAMAIRHNKTVNLSAAGQQVADQARE